MARIRRLPLVSLLALGFAMPAVAQVEPAQPSPQAEPQDRERDVVVVTAQKREETVQDIAVAVTAITSELRDEIGLTTVQDYTNFAPGLSYSTSNDRLGMRGVTRTSNNFGIRSGISNYVDGVYYSSAIPASREPILVERVEVVRGPQGTLYGRDSIGGALNVITKRPTEEFEGQVNMGAGNFDSMKVEATMAGPITDFLRYRVSGIRSAQDEGFLTNYSGLETEGGRRDDSYLEAQLEGNIGDRFDWWVRAGSLSWDVRKGAPGARTSVDDPYPYNQRFFNSTAELGPNGWFGLADPGRTQVGTQTTNPSLVDRNGFNTDFTNFAYLAPTTELTTEAVWHADNFDIKYLGGYVWYHYNLQQDQDGTAVKRFTCTPAMAAAGCTSGRTYHTERVSDYNENRGWYSNEINFISTWDGPLQLVSGIYQYQENYNQIIFVSQITDPGGTVHRLADLLAGNFVSPVSVQAPFTGRKINSGAPHGGSLMFRTNNQGLNNAYGAFIQGDYELNDQLKFTAGIRWSQDDMTTREYARVINHYVVQAAIAPLFGPFAAFVPTKIDVTDTLGGADPSTYSAANPCGSAARGVVNANPTTANGTAGPAVTNPLGCDAQGTNARDKTRYGVYIDQWGNSYRDLEGSWTEITGVLGVDWTPDADTLIYGKYNRGYKPGGLGCAATFCTQVATPYTDKELVDAFEVGFKRDWRELNLITNAVLFYYDYQGYQVSNTIVPDDPDGAGPLPRPAPYASYVNLPSTKTTGFELETIWTPTDNLRLLFNYGYTNPEIGESPALVHNLDPFALDPAAQPLGPAAACTPPAVLPPGVPAGQGCHGVQGQSLDGNILPFSPKHKIALNGTYTFDFEDGSTLDTSLSYFWQDIAFSSIFNRSYTKIPSWDQVDARISWTNADGNITLIGFVRNLLDEIVYDSRGAGLRESASTATHTPNPLAPSTRYTAPTECFTTTVNTPTFGAAPQQSCYTLGETLRPPMTFGAELQFRF
jgi:iron complex outermembrane recepter protein